MAVVRTVLEIAQQPGIQTKMDRLPMKPESWVDAIVWLARNRRRAFPENSGIIPELVWKHSRMT
jgi:hypothetical protein